MRFGIYFNTNLSSKPPKVLIFSKNNDISHKLETSWDYFWLPNNFRKKIDNLFIIVLCTFSKNSVIC